MWSIPVVVTILLAITPLTIPTSESATAPCWDSDGDGIPDTCGPCFDIDGDGVCDFVGPQPPILAWAIGGNHQVSLNWMAAAPVSVDLYRGTDPTALTYWMSVGSTVTSATDTGLPNGVFHYYKVASGADESNVIAAYPHAPPFVAWTVAGNHQVSLNWHAFDSTSVSAYDLFKGADPNTLTYWTSVGPTIHSASDVGLPNGVTQWYKVVANTPDGSFETNVAAGYPHAPTYPFSTTIIQTSPGGTPSVTTVAGLGNCTVSATIGNATVTCVPPPGDWACSVPAVHSTATSGIVRGSVGCGNAGSVTATAVAPNTAFANKPILLQDHPFFCFAEFGTLGTGKVKCYEPDP